MFNDYPQKLGLDFDLTELSFGIFGFLLVIMMVLRPEGLIPERRRQLELTRGHRRRRLRARHERDGLRGTGTRERARAAGDGRRRDLLTAEHITKVFGGLVAVEDVNFAIPERSIVSIIGPNGAGKTTFFNMLTGLYKPTYGQDHLRRARTSPGAGPTAS